MIRLYCSRKSADSRSGGPKSRCTVCASANCAASENAYFRFKSVPSVNGCRMDDVTHTSVEWHIKSLSYSPGIGLVTAETWSLEEIIVYAHVVWSRTWHISDELWPTCEWGRPIRSPIPFQIIALFDNPSFPKIRLACHWCPSAPRILK